MSPQVALLLTIGFVVFLFQRDSREQPRVTGALWIPLLWLLIICSRYASQWLGAGGASDLTEGSPLDAAVFLLLQVAGLVVLVRRRVSLSTFMSANVWLAAFLGYAALSILWSDFPFVAFKRWGKVLGHPIMILVIATEPDPRAALKCLMKRAAFVLIPVSITFIKYYPELGRGFDPWSGESTSTGITMDKSALGQDCLIFGFFFAWHFLTTLTRPKGRARRNELTLSLGFLAMIGWVLYMARSTTSTMTLVLGISIVLLLRRGLIDKKRIGAYLATGVVLFAVVEWLFGVSASVINALGKDATLTGRTELWEDVLKFNVNPIFGAGFESFWLGPRIEWFWAKYWWRPNQAHNGYIEMYLNLGWLGVILLLGWLGSVFRKANVSLLRDFEFGMFRMGLLLIIVVVNYTEATFKALHPLLFVFYIIAIDYPKSTSDPAHKGLPGTRVQDAPKNISPLRRRTDP